MTPVAITFVFAAWVVQRAAVLPSPAGLFSLLITALIILCLVWRKLAPRRLYPLLLSIASFLIGLCWAAGFALWRLSDALPVAWQQQYPRYWRDVYWSAGRTVCAYLACPNGPDRLKYRRNKLPIHFEWD